MEISVIASGSNGNCCLVEDKGSAVLVDAGLAGREIERRMHRLGKSPENIDAVLLTHSHHDHVQGAGVISRRYNVPLYMTHQTFMEARHKLGRVQPVLFSTPFSINGMNIIPVRTSHAVESRGFVIGEFGIFTDTGTVTSAMQRQFPKLRAVLLETNHDVDMVLNGLYPYPLKQWILSDTGHLSNIDACTLINDHGRQLELALLGHLSKDNNTKEVVKASFEQLVSKKINCTICSRDKETGNYSI